MRWIRWLLTGHRTTNAVLSDTLRRLTELESQPRPSYDPVQLVSAHEDLDGRHSELFARVVQLEAEGDDVLKSVKDLTLAVAEGIERVTRAEKRIAKTVQRARAELKARGLEDPGLEAEDHELREFDGERGAEGGLRIVPGEVDPPTPEASSIKGVSVDDLRRARGY